MNFFSFPTNTIFDYHWCGKFIAPGPDWIHMTRALNDFELIVMLKGTLYIAGEYPMMKPEVSAIQFEKDSLYNTAVPGFASSTQELTNSTQEFILKEGEYLLMPPTAKQYGTLPSDCSFYWLHFSNTSSQNTKPLYNTASPVNADYIKSQKIVTISSKINTTKDDYVKNKKTNISLSDNPTEIISLPLTGSIRTIDRITLLIKQLQDSDRRYRNNTLNNYLTGAILTELALQSVASSEVEQARYREQICQDITDYISWHLGEPLRCSQVAEYFGYNEKYLTTFFRKNYGMALKDYITQEKMVHAKAQLTETNSSISHIAYSIGFEDVHNFSNAFKKSVGISPSDYRELYSKHNVFNV